MIKPHRHMVEAFQSWMEGEADGRGVPVITGLSANRVLDASDVVALHPPVDQDWLSRFVRRYFRIPFVVSTRCLKAFCIEVEMEYPLTCFFANRAQCL
jgi:hypothetical protein